jgi:hypothetical protein
MSGYHFFEQEGGSCFADVVDVGLVDLCVLEFDGIGEEAAEAAAPLDDACNCYTKHQIVCLDIFHLVA